MSESSEFHCYHLGLYETYLILYTGTAKCSRNFYNINMGYYEHSTEIKRVMRLVNE